MQEGLFSVSRDVLKCIVEFLNDPYDIINLSMVNHRTNYLLKERVNLILIQKLHEQWTLLYFRRQKSYLQYWCHLLLRTTTGDASQSRLVNLKNRSKFHMALVKKSTDLCYVCGENCSIERVDCFVPWIEQHCLCCVRSDEYGFIENGSAGEEEIDNQVSF